MKFHDRKKYALTSESRDAQPIEWLDVSILILVACHYSAAHARNTVERSCVK